MSVTQFVFLFSMLGATSPAPSRIDPPGVPLDLKRAEEQGLHRLSVAELRQWAPNIAARQANRAKITKTTLPVGREKASDGKASRINEANSTYCDRFTRKRNGEESCFAVFRAATGVHYFGYDIERGGHPHVWRRSSGKWLHHRMQ